MAVRTFALSRFSNLQSVRTFSVNCMAIGQFRSPWTNVTYGRVILSGALDAKSHYKFGALAAVGRLHTQQGTQEPRLVKTADPLETHEATLPHPIWSREELVKVMPVHRPPKGFADHLAFYTIQVLRSVYDVSAGFMWGKRTESKWIRRLIFLETVAGVPGMVGAMVRHLKSLRVMKQDHGWIHTLLEEAENERMHLMTFLQLKNPGIPMRLGVMAAQGIYVTAFSVTYFISPSFCHRLVGYLEEEAVKTYTKCLEDIETGSIKHWKSSPAPELAISYWHLPSDSATLHDVVLVIRADEAHHRHVNHSLASISTDDYNPHKPGQ